MLRSEHWNFDVGRLFQKQGSGAKLQRRVRINGVHQAAMLQHDSSFALVGIHKADSRAKKLWQPSSEMRH